MVGKSHAVFGVGCFLTAVPFIDLPFFEALMYLPLALLGSLAPDLDAGNSKLKSNILIKFLTLPLSFFGHRTWSHSFLAIGLISSLIFYIDEFYTYALLAFVIGYSSHILGDFMTPMGVPLLYPYKKKFRFILTFKTGSFIEYFIAIIPITISGTLFLNNSELFV